MSIIKIENLCKTYEKDNKKISVLKNINYKFEEGKIYNIVGHSGAGKSTILNILGTLISYDSGNLWIDGMSVSKMTNQEKAKIRNRKIGFVFQSYLLNEQLKAYENVMVPMYINPDINKKDRKRIAESLLDKVKILERSNHFPKELSGGEQQRVAIARSLANNPKIILADEPTGNLDKKNEKKILEIFKSLKEEGKCIIIVSHSDYVKEYADVVLELDDGHLEVLK